MGNQYEDKELRAKVTQEVSNSIIEMAKAHRRGQSGYEFDPLIDAIMQLITQKQLETERQILKDMQFRLKDALRPSSDIRKIIRLRLALEAVEFRLAESEKGRKL